jgi:hypothetical protein
MFFNHSFAILLALIAPVAHAQVPNITIPVSSFGPVCQATGLCISQAAGSLSLANFLTNIIVPSVRMIFIGVAIAYVASYSFEMIVGGGEDSVLTEKKKAFGYAALGMAVAGFTSLFAAAFAPSAVGNGLVAPAPIAQAAQIVFAFIEVIAGAFLVFVIGTSGFRIIVLQGNEGEIDKQKKNFFNSLIGIVGLFLAQVIVSVALPGTGPTPLITEIAGMIRFLLAVVASLAIVGFIVGGFMMMVSGTSDTLKQRGRRIFSSTIVILIIVIFSYALVSTFLGQ